jgi:hypothetical protein
MRGAFIVQLGPETRPNEGRLEGWVQEVDSCTELRFHSTEELLTFLAQSFDRAMNPTGKARVGDRKQSPIDKKNSGKEKRSR